MVKSYLVDPVKSRILLIGSINMDLVVNLNRMPTQGETVFGKSYAFIPGGKGANQGVAAARLGADVCFLGKIGDDANGKKMMQVFQDDGIDTSMIEIDKTAHTGLAVIPVEADGQNRIIVISGANMQITKKQIVQALTQTFDMILIGLEVPLEIVYETHKLANAAGIPVVLDAGPAMGIDLKQLNGIHVISPNETECHALTGIAVVDEASAMEAARKIACDCFPQYVVLKLGAMGAYLYAKGKGKLFAAKAVDQMVDTTAAGDCFTAALAIRLLETGDIEAAVDFANQAASICVGRKGAIPSLPFRRELPENGAEPHGKF